jgi:hypothetical protein
MFWGGSLGRRKIRGCRLFGKRALFNDGEERGLRSCGCYITGWFVFSGDERVVLSFVSACAACRVRLNLQVWLVCMCTAGTLQCSQIRAVTKKAFGRNASTVERHIPLSCVHICPLNQWVPSPLESKFQKHRFCRHDDMKLFTWFTLQPKSATGVGWWLVHYNFEKLNLKDLGVS